MRRDERPRVSSAMSGFFFCGMIELPVVNASSSSTNANCRDDHSTISSASRDRSTPSIAVTNRNSATWSRAPTASIEFSQGAS